MKTNKVFKANTKNKENKEEKTMNIYDKMKQAIENLKAEQIKEAAKKIEAEKAKRYEYNKKYRALNPLTKEQKDKRAEYHKKYNAAKKDYERKILEAAKEIEETN